MGDTQSGKFVHGTGSETIAAGFVAGKGGGVDKQHVVATVGGVKRCGGTGGTSADYEDVTGCIWGCGWRSHSVHCCLLVPIVSQTR